MATTISKDNIVLYGDGGHQINNAALLLFDGLKPEYDWIDANLCGELYHLCGDRLFKNADGIKFYMWLNLRAKTDLEPKPWAKTQIKYLIYHLAKLINFDDKYGPDCFAPSLIEEVRKYAGDSINYILYGRRDSMKDDLLRKSWEIRVSGLCGIKHSDMSKHRNDFRKAMTNKDSKRAIEKQKFIDGLDAILKKYRKLLADEEDPYRKLPYLPWISPKRR